MEDHFVTNYVRSIMEVDQIAGRELLVLNSKLISQELGIDLSNPNTNQPAKKEKK